MKKNNSFFVSKSVGISACIFLSITSILPCSYILVFLAISGRMSENIIVTLMMLLCLIVFLVFLLYLISMYFSKVSITELKIEKSFRNRFFRRTFLWEDVKSITYFCYMSDMIAISTKSEVVPSMVAVSRDKQVILLELNKETYQCLKHYSNLEVKGLESNKKLSRKVEEWDAEMKDEIRITN